MKVLTLGGYDAILGMVWLEQYSPMKCECAQKWVEFTYKGQLIRLQGVQDVSNTKL